MDKRGEAVSQDSAFPRGCAKGREMPGVQAIAFIAKLSFSSGTLNANWPLSILGL